MSNIENYDGLCGIIHLYASSCKQVRCKYDFGHGGTHSWNNIKVAFTISSHCGRSKEQIAEEGFINSVNESLKK
jgi:hypothetical protein